MWQLITAQSTGSVSAHADGEQAIITQLDMPEGADVVEVLNPAAVVLGNQAG